MENAIKEEQTNLIIEYAGLAVESAKKGIHIDASEHSDRAHEIRVKLKMSHKTICCLATETITK